MTHLWKIAKSCVNLLVSKSVATFFFDNKNIEIELGSNKKCSWILYIWGVNAEV